MLESPMDCKKCKGAGTVILRKKDPYCKTCFLTNTNHKFRACIGKNKILSSNEKVLICLSGGMGSMVLMDLIHSGINMDSHKKLRIIPYFLHLMDLESDNSATNDNITKTSNILIQQCNQYSFNVYVAHISSYLDKSNDLPDVNCIPPVNSDAQDQVRAILSSMAATSYNDVLLRIKQSLFMRFAKLLECKFIFTAETTTTLASNLLSNLAMGRGSQVGNDIGFCDARDENIKILRPMRDISKEELDHYIGFKELVSIHHRDIKENSIQSTIQKFVTDLQESFQATISTVCKTAVKIGVPDGSEKQEKCIVCKGDIGTETFNLSALDATNFSRTVSRERLQNHEHSTSYINVGQDINKSMFPFVHKLLCYSCIRNYSEIDECNLQKLLQNEV